LNNGSSSLDFNTPLNLLLLDLLQVAPRQRAVLACVGFDLADLAEVEHAHFAAPA
jgi:hypothetical protein